MEASTFHLDRLGKEIYARKLTSGDVIKAGDVMDDSQGVFQRVPDEFIGDQLTDDAGAVFLRMVLTT